MNKALLHSTIQDFILEKITADTSALVLKKPFFENVTNAALAAQITAKNKAKSKLPTWYASKQIYYPNTLNLEQSSSESTAHFKATLVSGNHLIDLTGGFGVDSYYFSKNFKRITHCELNVSLSEIVAHNYSALAITNVSCIATDGIAYLTAQEKRVDCLYIDPSRRNDHKGKVFLLADCLPDVTSKLDLFFEKADQVLIKTSPLLDISQALRELKHTKTVYVVAVNNEVKELLFSLELHDKGTPEIQAVNIKKNNIDTFSFPYNSKIKAALALPQQFLYEPNAAILKSGGFSEVGARFGINKLAIHSHLYTSELLVEDFPGRTFQIIEILAYHKKVIRKRFSGKKANFSTRNFPKSVPELRKETSSKDGGALYVFFTTTMHADKIVIITTKV